MTQTVAEAIRAATARLSATSDTARLDAELLMAHALGVSRSEMLLRHMNLFAKDGFEALVERRARHEPVAYILGWTEFYGRPFEVEPGVLIPRADSEVLIETALELCPAPRRVLDCGVGSGALLLTILAECPGATGVGIDRTGEAVSIAGDNAANLAIEGDWVIERRDWRKDGWQEGLGRFDLILCNPPYVERDAQLDPDVRDYEPAAALYAGEDGLDDYQIVIPQLRELMHDDAVAIFEIGATQAEAVISIALNAGFAAELRRDLANRPRALIMR